MSCKVNFYIVRSALQISVIKLLPIKSHDMALVPIHSLQWKPIIILKVGSGQNHDNKIAPQANFNPTAANIMDLLCIFVIIKQYFFQPVSELASTNYFCYIYTNNFFIHTTNYFSVVLRIIFLMCIENYFSRALQLKGTCSSVWPPWRPFRKLCKRRSAFKGNAKAKHCQGKKRKKFSSFLTKSERSQ